MLHSGERVTLSDSELQEGFLLSPSVLTNDTGDIEVAEKKSGSVAYTFLFSMQAEILR